MSQFGWKCNGCGGEGRFDSELDTLFDLEKRARREHDKAGHAGCAGDVRLVIQKTPPQKVGALWEPQS